MDPSPPPPLPPLPLSLRLSLPLSLQFVLIYFILFSFSPRSHAPILNVCSSHFPFPIFPFQVSELESEREEAVRRLESARSTLAALDLEGKSKRTRHEKLELRLARHDPTADSTGKNKKSKSRRRRSAAAAPAPYDGNPAALQLPQLQPQVP